MSARIAALLASRGGACLALAAFVFAARAWLIAVWGSPVPFWDQWDAESALYRSWLTNTWTWGDFFAPHNEHRILLTRGANLALFSALGGWHPWAQLLLNAALHAATAILLTTLFWPVLAGRSRAFFLAGVAILFAATAGWQNALWGFQSQVYFTSLLAIGGFGALALAAPGSGRGWLGPALLGAALLASAGGLLAVLAGVAVMLLRWNERGARWLLLALAGVVVVGFSVHVVPPQHEALRARDAGQFLAVLAHSLSWPHVDSGWLWVVVQVPLAGLLAVRWRQRTALDPAERLALGLVIFAGINAAAIAYSRGGGLPELRPLSRYQDPLLLGAAGNLFAALRLANVMGRPGRLLALGWSTAVAAGLLILTTTNLTLNLPYKRAQDAAGLAQIRSYLTTRDATVFTADPNHPPPHPDPKAIQRVLDDPVLRPVLPPVFFSSNPATKPWALVHARTLFSIAAAAMAGALLCLVWQPQMGRTPR